MDTLKLIIDGLWAAVKAIATLTIVGVISYKIYLTPMSITVDFPTLLSLLLAMFSVGLAALFYFKATDTSNKFYDNTYTFTKDISQLLVKIESGFGEKLSNLDSSYNYMRDHIQNYPSREESKEEVLKVEQEKVAELKKATEERDALINKLLEKTELIDTEKQNFRNQLQLLEKQLDSAQSEISSLERLKSQSTGFFSTHIQDFTIERVIKPLEIGKNQMSISEVKNLFSLISNDLPSSYKFDLLNLGLIDEHWNLTDDGAIILGELGLKFYQNSKVGRKPTS